MTLEKASESSRAGHKENRRSKRDYAYSGVFVIRCSGKRPCAEYKRKRSDKADYEAEEKSRLENPFGFLISAERTALGNHFRNSYRKSRRRNSKQNGIIPIRRTVKPHGI